MVIFMVTKGELSITHNYVLFPIEGYVVVCYTTNWAQYRSTPYKFTTNLIDASVCTHIIHSFAQISNGVLDWYEYNDNSKLLHCLHNLECSENLISCGKL